MKRIKTGLRQNAAKAKSRLSGGFWTHAHAPALTLAGLNNPTSDGEVFFRRVCDLYNRGEGNILTKMLEPHLMSSLAAADRERYVLKTATRVTECLARLTQTHKVG